MPEAHRGKLKIEDEDILKVLETADPPVLATKEVAEAVDMSRKGVLNRLEDLEEEGKIRKKTIGRSSAWMPPDIDRTEPAKEKGWEEAEEELQGGSWWKRRFLSVDAQEDFKNDIVRGLIASVILSAAFLAVINTPVAREISAFFTVTAYGFTGIALFQYVVNWLYLNVWRTGGIGNNPIPEGGDR